MRSPWELAADAMRCLRDLAAAADRVADGFVQAAGLLASLVYSFIRVFRALLTILRTLATGYRTIAVLLFQTGMIIADFRNIFTPASRRRFRREAREQRRADRELRRRESERAWDAAVPAREDRARREDSDGYPSTPGSSGSSDGSFFSARSY